MKLKRAILAVSLQKRIAKLKTEEGDPESSDMGDEADAAPGFAGIVGEAGQKASLADKVKSGAVFREVVLAKLREEKQKQESLQTDDELVQEARRRSFNASS